MVFGTGKLKAYPPQLCAVFAKIMVESQPVHMVGAPLPEWFVSVRDALVSTYDVSAGMGDDCYRHPKGTPIKNSMPLAATNRVFGYRKSKKYRPILHRTQYDKIKKHPQLDKTRKFRHALMAPNNCRSSRSKLAKPLVPSALTQVPATQRISAAMAV